MVPGGGVGQVEDGGGVGRSMVEEWGGGLGRRNVGMEQETGTASAPWPAAFLLCGSPPKQADSSPLHFA